MSDDDRKVVSLRAATNRRDWGDGTIEEITHVLNNALENGERITIFIGYKDANNNCGLSTYGYTRHGFKVSWLEHIAMLQIKLHEWYSRAFQ